MNDVSSEGGIARLVAFGNYAAMLATMLVVAGVLTMALVLQYAEHELPCPLCLLQRVAMLGVCFSMLLQIRNGFSYQNLGFGLVFAVLLLIIAERQTLLDIYPRPGHAYVGTAIFGMHMPVWSTIVGLCLIAAYAIRLTLFGGVRQLAQFSIRQFPALAAIGTVLGIYVILLAVINFGSVIVQCGAGECHTGGYKLLGFEEPAATTTPAPVPPATVPATPAATPAP